MATTRSKKKTVLREKTIIETIESRNHSSTIFGASANSNSMTNDLNRQQPVSQSAGWVGERHKPDHNSHETRRRRQTKLAVNRWSPNQVFFALSECLNLWMKPRFSGDFIWLMTFEFELSETGSCRLVRISWPHTCWRWSWIWEADSCEVIDAVVWLNCPRAFLFRGFSSGGSWVVKEIDGLGADHPRGEWFFFGSGVWKGLGLTKVSYLSNWDEEMQWIQATR